MNRPSIPSTPSMTSMLSIIVLVLALARSSFAFDPAPQDITMQAGEDYRLELGVNDSLNKAVNLSGYAFAAQFRATAAGALFANYSAIVVDAPKGRLELRLSKATTRALSGKAGVWDLQQTEPGGLTSYVLRGRVAVLPTVTR